MNLTPAYGRDYGSRAAILADLKSGKDFIIADMSSPYNGKPINNVGLVNVGRDVTVRYSNLRKVAVFKVKELV